mmetsp:Transcript_10064/g.38111  ORF Transcript_10064/g.38111 Transcript_10064/m.38111 type:complete len:105 (-) Transcript_10064:926-1240(-)|eukprot:scaffold2141_cov282-Pinguiococcus_pyrenoidosus.AAC.8
MGGSQSASKGTAPSGSFAVEVTPALAEQIMNVEANRRAKVEQEAAKRDEELQMIEALLVEKQNMAVAALAAEQEAMQMARKQMEALKDTIRRVKEQRQKECAAL